MPIVYRNQTENRMKDHKTGASFHTFTEHFLGLGHFGGWYSRKEGKSKT